MWSSLRSSLHVNPGEEELGVELCGTRMWSSLWSSLYGHPRSPMGRMSIVLGEELVVLGEELVKPMGRMFIVCRTLRML